MTRLLAMFSLLLCLGLLPCVTRATETIDREYPLKAAYLFNIFKFITWPNISTSTPEQLLLCITKSEHSIDALLDLNNKQIDNIIIKVRTNVDPTKASTCQVLYFTKGEINSRLDHLTKQGVLLIGEQTNFMAQGGTLNLFVANNKLRFEINLHIAQQAGIKISSRLLKLADIYKNEIDRELSND